MLNLPARAKVTLDGITVGIVTGVAVARNHVDVTTRMDRAVSVPANIQASLQQATVLGDIYVALDRPVADGTAPALASGARIPLAQTTSPPQLEDTIAHLADFTGSGSVQRIQSTIIGINRITPPQNDIRRMATQFAVDMADLSNNIDNVDLMLNGAAETAQVLHARVPMLKTCSPPKVSRGGPTRTACINTQARRIRASAASTQVDSDGTPARLAGQCRWGSAEIQVGVRKRDSTMAEALHRLLPSAG